MLNSLVDSEFLIFGCQIIVTSVYGYSSSLIRNNKEALFLDKCIHIARIFQLPQGIVKLYDTGKAGK